MMPTPIDLEKLGEFLKAALQYSYANKDAKRADSLRPGSKDYHFEKDNLAYHDTYFGATKFLGEEIVYQDGVAVWGMNYFGFALDENVSEEMYDAIMRPALLAGSGDNIPVRGPKEFVQGEWKYAFVPKGNLNNFSGLEEISLNDKVVCRLYCHGGIIK